MRHFLTSTALGVLLAFPLAAEAFNPQEKEEIQKIIREYLVSNPEVLMESMQAMQVAQEKQKKKDNTERIGKYKDRLFHHAGSPALGPKDADITVVEFFDYNCGACKMMFKSLDDYMEEDSKIRVVFKEYPIFGEHSKYPASIALAIYQEHPEQYYAFHKALMEYKGRVTSAVVDSVLGSMQLDAEALKKKANSKEITTVLNETSVLARDMNVAGTPMVVINDEIVPHAMSLEMLQQKVTEIRKRKKKSG